MRRNMFWVVAFSCLPGLGHMYMGFTRRGVAIMSTFFAVAAVSYLFDGIPFGFLLPVLGCYALFDAVKINRAAGQGYQDDFWIYRSCNAGGKAAFLFGSNAKWIGWALVVIGAAYIYKGILSPVLYELFGEFEVARRLIYNFPTLVVSFVAIYFGIQLIRPRHTVRTDRLEGSDGQ